ncbi:MAG: Gfo/Idh/MocA family oxidoreductase [Bacteroidota bacterium]|nr:Gfo/Idh/MocA family oxidoreductase [Bacteroidota bacterium]
MDEQLKVGIVGAGGFATFAAQSFLKVEGIQIVGVTDVHPAASATFAELIGCETFADLEQLLATEADLIYIATPPSLHAIQSRKALEAGKHVICEKPAALHAAEAEELAAFANKHQLLYVVNLMQRYNPLYSLVKEIIDQKWFGDFVHGFFENYASDEKLVRDHWFWDEAHSGGIFIEHGVHFFDMFSGWLGVGKLLHSMQIAREGNEGKVVDRVQAVVMYDKGPVNFYHGFNQPKVLDRQEMRLQFDRGDITLYEWVPVKIRIHGLFTRQLVEQMDQLFPDSEIEWFDEIKGDSYQVVGKFKPIKYDCRLTWTSGDIEEKMDRYEELVISMIKDQWAWIKDSTHVRKIDDRNAVESLRIAEEATLRSERYTR